MFPPSILLDTSPISVARIPLKMACQTMAIVRRISSSSTSPIICLLTPYDQDPDLYHADNTVQPSLTLSRCQLRTCLSTLPIKLSILYVSDKPNPLRIPLSAFWPAIIRTWICTRLIVHLAPRIGYRRSLNRMTLAHIFWHATLPRQKTSMGSSI